jgi:uncharacterized protein YuzE
MRIAIDREADAGYIYLQEIRAGEVEETVPLNEDINIDLDSEGRILGIEILSVSKNLPKTFSKN